jgi:hypothetical protein
MTSLHSSIPKLAAALLAVFLLIVLFGKKESAAS